MPPKLKDVQDALDQERNEHAATKTRMQAEIDSLKENAGASDKEAAERAARERAELEDKLKKQAADLKRIQEESDAEKKSKQAEREKLEKEKTAEIEDLKSKLRKSESTLKIESERRTIAEEKYDQQRAEMDDAVDGLLRFVKDKQSHSVTMMQQSSSAAGSPSNNLNGSIRINKSLSKKGTDGNLGMISAQGAPLTATESSNSLRLPNTPDGSPNGSAVSPRRKPSILKNADPSTGSLSFLRQQDSRPLQAKLSDLKESTTVVLDRLEMRLHKEVADHAETKACLKKNLEKLYEIEQKPIDMMYQTGALTARPRLESEFKELEFQLSMKKRQEMMNDYQSEFSVRNFCTSTEQKGAPYISPSDASPFRRKAVEDYERQRQVILGKRAEEAGMHATQIQGQQRGLATQQRCLAMGTAAASVPDADSPKIVQAKVVRSNSKSLVEAASEDPDKADGMNSIRMKRMGSREDQPYKQGSVIIQDTIDLKVENEDKDDDDDAQAEKQEDDKKSAKNTADKSKKTEDDDKEADEEKKEEKSEKKGKKNDAGEADDDIDPKKKDKQEKKEKDAAVDDDAGDDGKKKKKKKKKDEKDDMDAIVPNS